MEINNTNNNNRDINYLFYYCFRNVYLNNKIFGFVKTTKEGSGISKLIQGKFNYYQMNDANLMAMGREDHCSKNLLRVKVEKGEILNFKINEYPIPFMKIFENFKNLSTDYQFFNQLFKNYFIGSSIEETVCYSMMCNNKIAILVLLENYGYNPSNIEIRKLYLESIKNGSCQVTSFLKNKFQSSVENITNLESNELFNSLINKEKQIKNINETIQHLINELNVNFPLDSSIVYSKIIEFSILNVNLEFILSTCYSIALIGKINSFNFKYPELVKNIEILSIDHLNSIKYSLSNQELQTNIMDLKSNDQIVSKLVGMSIKFTNQNFQENIIFYNQRYSDSGFGKIEFKGNEIINFNEINEISISNGNYKQIISNIDQVIIPQLNQQQQNDGNEIDLFQGISIYNKSFKIFKSVPIDKFQQVYNNFVQDIINHQRYENREYHNRHSLMDIVRLLVEYNDIGLIDDFFTRLSENFIIIYKPPNEIYNLVKSIEMFDFLFNKFTNSFRLNEIIDQGHSNCYMILSHFKTNYNVYYNKLVLRYRPKVNHLSNEFITDNIDDFKLNLISNEFWTLRNTTNITVNQFIIYCNIIPTDQSIHCFNSIYNLEYLYINPDSRFNYSNRTNISDFYSIGKLKEIINNNLDKPIEFPNFTKCLEMLIVSLDFENLKFLLDYFNLSNSCHSLFKPYFDNALITISQNNSITILSFLYKNYKNLFTRDSLSILYNNCINSSKSIEILDYLKNIIKFKPIN